MQEGLQRTVTRADIERLAEGHLKIGERKQIVRSLLARAARSQVPGQFQPPVAESNYDKVLERAFKRAWRLHQRLVGRGSVAVSPDYSLAVPAGSRL